LPVVNFNHPFLQAFPKPVRDQTCECAREDEPNFPLHLLNYAGLFEKYDRPKVDRGLVAGREEATELIYVSTLSRRPTQKQREIVENFLDLAAMLEAGFRDLQNTLMNLNKFLLWH